MSYITNAMVVGNDKRVSTSEHKKMIKMLGGAVT